MVLFGRVRQWLVQIIEAVQYLHIILISEIVILLKTTSRVELMQVNTDAVRLVISHDLVVPVAAVFGAIDVQSFIEDPVGDV